MHESDAWIKLRVACQALLEAGHADQNEAEPATIEPIAQLLHKLMVFSRSASSTISSANG